MAAITPTTLAWNTVSADLPVTAGTAITHGNTDTILYPDEGDLLIVLNNTTAAEHTVTFSAGFGVAAGVGSLDVTMAQDDVKFIVLSSDRFKSSAGKVTVDYSDNMTGFVMAFYTPK